MAEYCLTAILTSGSLSEALTTIDMQDEEFINRIIWSIKEGVDLNCIDKLEFVTIFADIAIQFLVQKRIEVDNIYGMYLEQFLDKA